MSETARDFLRRACAMEAEAAERYAELAAQMDTHHNREVAALFAELARIEGLHRDQLLAKLGLEHAPDPAAFRWETPEGPETTDYGELHYLMRARHALALALHNEQRAARFYEAVAQSDAPADLRAEAAEMAAEEREHVRLIQEWLARVPAAEAGGDEDPDPPVAVD